MSEANEVLVANEMTWSRNDCSLYILGFLMIFAAGDILGPRVAVKFLEQSCVEPLRATGRPPDLTIREQLGMHCRAGKAEGLILKQQSWLQWVVKRIKEQSSQELWVSLGKSPILRRDSIMQHTSPGLTVTKSWIWLAWTCARLCQNCLPPRKHIVGIA